MESTQEIITVQDLSAYLKVAPLTIYRMAQRGKIPAFKVGSDWRFKKSEIDQWTRAQTSPARTVLVVDDDAGVRRLVERVLSQRGFDVVTAQTGEEGLAHVADLRVDVAVVDLSLPGMDGAEAIAAMRIRRPDLPILIITGHPESGLLEKAFQVGHFSVLVKPFEPRRLAEAVHQLCWGATRSV